MLSDSVRIKKELRGRIGLRQEIGGEVCYPIEKAITGTGLKHEEGNHLLEKEANNDSCPSTLLERLAGRCMRGVRLTRVCDYGA